MTVVDGKEALMELLLKEGVEFVFGLPGATETLFMDALEDHPEIKYILCLHEVVALGMAEGYARTSGKVGVVNLHTNTGLAAATPMLCNASQGGVPLIVTAGQQDTRLLMQEPALAGDLVRIASPFAKWSTEISQAADIPLVMQRAFKVAMQPPTGPVFVSLPQNVLDENLDFEYSSATPYLTHLCPDQGTINAAVDLLIKAQRPALIVEDGVAKSEALSEVVEFAELIGARVYQPWMSDVNFPVNHPLYLGDLDVGSMRAKEILESVDMLVVVGARLFSQPFYLPEPLLTAKTKIIQIDDNPWQIAKNFSVAVGIEGDIKTSVSKLIEALQNRMSAKVHRAADIRKREITRERKIMTGTFMEKAKQERNHIPIAVSRLMQELKDAIKPGTLVVDDCWSCSSELRRTVDFTEPRSFQRSRGGGSIGWGMSGSLGVKLAAPDRPVVAVVGDGSAVWSIQSLWTAAHYHIPVTYVICANGSYCQVRIMKMRILGEKAEGRYLGTDFCEPRIDFCNMAASMGVQGTKVERPEELKCALKSALDSNKPALVEVHIESVM